MEATSNFELIVKAKQDIRSGSYSEILQQIPKSQKLP